MALTGYTNKPPFGTKGVRHSNPNPRKGLVPNVGLTQNQEKFAQLVVNQGLSYTEAYRQSYATANMKPSTIMNCACKLAAHPMVRGRMVALQAEKDRRKPQDAAETRAYIAERLRQEADNAERASDRLRALELMGKLDGVGAFKERQEVELKQDRTPEQVAAELAARLEAHLNQGLIDVTPMPDQGSAMDLEPCDYGTGGPTAEAERDPGDPTQGAPPHT